MLRPSLLLPALVLALFLACPVGALAGGGQGQPGGHLVALLGDERIDLGAVGLYHCHDLDMPIIRCFQTEAARDADALAGLTEDEPGGLLHGLSSTSLMGITTVTYVLWYEHSNYLGASYFATAPISNLGTFGWSNRISSFKSTNGGSPTWWDLTNYSGSSWNWPASAWVPFVGLDANDRFTSVQVP